MSEKIRLTQNQDYEVEFLAADPHQPDAEELAAVHGLHEITPYTMMLFSLAGCTAQVALGYAAHHEIDLEEVEIELAYQRDYQEDCENCEEIEKYQEEIEGEILFKGELSENQRQKLLQIARQCPIEKMYEHGIPIQITLPEN